MIKEEKWYCHACLHPLELSEECECVKCGRELDSEYLIIGHDEMLRKKAAAEREFNQARKDGLFR